MNKVSEALKSVKTFHDWLIRAHGASCPLEQDVVDKFAEMQMESMDAVEQALPIAEQMEKVCEAAIQYADTHLISYDFKQEAKAKILWAELHKLKQLQEG